jgi:hypothetical protein
VQLSDVPLLVAWCESHRMSISLASVLASVHTLGAYRWVERTGIKSRNTRLKLL